MNTQPLFLNLSNHPSAQWDEAQRSAAEAYGALEDMAFPPIDPEWEIAEVEQLAETYAEKISEHAKQRVVTVHLMGELTFCFALVRKLQERGVRCVASCAKRETKDMDGGAKLAVFKFVRFREYTL